MNKSVDEPLAICGARSKRTGNPCRQRPMKNGRCRLHGGKSTGPKTLQGLEKSRKANWKHGLYSQESVIERKKFRALYQEMHSFLKSVEQYTPHTNNKLADVFGDRRHFIDF